MNANTYYAVCDVNGPISVRFVARSIEEVITEFEAGDDLEWINEPRLDAEDDLGIAGDGMSEEQFAKALVAAGCREVQGLTPIVNTLAGTVVNLLGGWILWVRDES